MKQLQTRAHGGAAFEASLLHAEAVWPSGTTETVDKDEQSDDREE